MKIKSLTQGNVKLAITGVRSTKWRSFLTTLGIAIGVVLVISIVSIGEGVKHQVSEQIDHLGRDLITVRPGQLVTQASSNSIKGVNLLSSLNVNGALAEKDVRIVQTTEGVKITVPLSIVTGTVQGNSKLEHAGLVIGTTEDLPQAVNQKVAYGTFFTSDDDNANKAVIGSKVAGELFDSNVPLGRAFTLRGQQFVVVGILDELDTAPLSVDTDFNKAIFIPYSTAKQITNGSAPIYEILAKPANIDMTDETVAKIDSNLLTAHSGQRDFTVLKQQESLNTTSNILNLLTALIGGVAAISLLVGGIGIMNVMLVSVTERMHEIGIRKAVGATNQQILNQFITEAGVLSLTGGVLGIAISYLISAGLYIFTDLKPIITWQIVLLAVGVSVLVGIVFGSAPALKAARKNPIEALRNEL